jgi:hypothetical protein
MGFRSHAKQIFVIEVESDRHEFADTRVSSTHIECDLIILKVNNVSVDRVEPTVVAD